MTHDIPRQRALRSPRTARPSPRLRNTTHHQAWLVGHLTPRDRWLLRMLYEHKVLTTNQIIDLAFPSRRSANLRLKLLYEWGLIYRFQPHRETGSYPLHYVLDTTGATILAHEAGVAPKELNYSRSNAARYAYSLQLAHNVACNSLFVSLIHRGRQPHATSRLTTWWSAARCTRLWGDIVRPDGYARWRQPDGSEFDWYLEFDLGTEQRSRITDKVHRYGQLAISNRRNTPVLFWFASPRREASVRQALLEDLNQTAPPDRVPIATTNSYTAEHPLDMITARWLPMSARPVPDRVRFTELSTIWPEIPQPEPLDHTEEHYLLAPQPIPPPNLEYRTRTAT